MSFETPVGTRPHQRLHHPTVYAQCGGVVQGRVASALPGTEVQQQQQQQQHQVVLGDLQDETRIDSLSA
jgi:hypothetical protein